MIQIGFFSRVCSRSTTGGKGSVFGVLVIAALLIRGIRCWICLFCFSVGNCYERAREKKYVARDEGDENKQKIMVEIVYK